ncbi:MAG: precorrin-2 C(20)-methyltransferase [Paramuribaculum sp.]|nr:precorrin-2 C(20)-methyltransferase [Paramuribaculum sp.]
MHPIIFVSLGPGDPELISIKGLKALMSADCIFCPQTFTKDNHTTSRAADIILSLGINSCNIRRFTLPMSKQRDKAIGAYNKVYIEATKLQSENKKICIVAEGDAGFYSSIHYIFDKLQANGIPVTQIAGIPAFIAAGALGGLHVANQNERLTVIPGATTAEEIEKLINENSNIVIMKLSQCTDQIHRCIHLHPEYSYHYFENIGTSNQKYLNNSQEIASISYPYFSLLIIQHNHN